MDSDSLIVKYKPLPNWLTKSYGNKPDKFATSIKKKNNSSNLGPQKKLTNNQNDLSITGAKTFRFNSNSTGAADFTQSLDLSISGSLGNDVELTGSISDRGYNPSYGTANSRINELDKIKLQLSSPKLNIQIGDIQYRGLNNPVNSSLKKLSGASLNYNASRFNLDFTAARPKGRFSTIKIFGVDTKQGPYQLNSNNASLPVVPGSEQIWLDGVELKKGSNLDYLIDYVSGEITFNAKHPIDSRSRIEIDYEPLTTSYQGELFAGGAGVNVEDSLLKIMFNWVREGDDKNNLLAGTLSETDKQIIAMAGDSAALAIRNSIIDTIGAYVLLNDSLPDSVYQYVGEGLGDYDIRFSFIGQQQGDYVFAGRDEYRYVGHDNGEYLPVRLLPLPERNDIVSTTISTTNDILGEASLSFAQSTYDKNLFSNISNDDNTGIYFELKEIKRWVMDSKENSISFYMQSKEKEFNNRNRIYGSDFDRNYYSPGNLKGLTDEKLYKTEAKISPFSFGSINVSFAKLDYKNLFESKRIDLKTLIDPQRKLKFNLGLSTVRADLQIESDKRKGFVDNYFGKALYRLSNKADLSINYELDERENYYKSNKTGTRYNKIGGEVKFGNEEIYFENYIEDSLINGWLNILNRNRISISSKRKFKQLRFNSNLTYQQSELFNRKENSLLSRLTYNYSAPRTRTNFSGIFSLSNETRNARGINYLEVENGQGNFIFEDGEYIPDDNGNFIRVDEILSDNAKVKNGEKSFQIRTLSSIYSVRFNSYIREELDDSKNRNLWWVIPFYSDEKQSYQFYQREYNADLKLFPVKNYYYLNFVLAESIEIRQVSSSQKIRKDRQLSFSVKHNWHSTYFESLGEYFNFDRDRYFSNGGVINGFKLSQRITRQFNKTELTSGFEYRKASSDNGNEVKSYSIISKSVMRFKKRGEIVGSLDLYSQTIENISGFTSYLLTGNRPGSKGAVWSLKVNLGLKEGMRFNLSLSGHHSDNRRARVFARGELIAGF